MHGDVRIVTWAPLVCLVGTIAGLLFAFDRLGTEPEWKTLLVSVVFNIAATAVGVIVLCVVALIHRE